MTLADAFRLAVSHARPLVAFGAGLLVLLGAAGCGDDGADRTGRGLLAGPPQWRSVREEGPAHESRLALQCATPCRVRFRLELPEDRVEVQPWRVLGTGQTIQVWWSVEVMPEELQSHLAHPGAPEAGRTEPHGVVLNFQYDDRAFTHNRWVVWTRPGKGRLLRLEAVPPGAYDPLSLPGSVELATVAVTDLAAGSAELKRRVPRNRLVLPGPLAEGDRTRILRLFLELAPLDD